MYVYRWIAIIPVVMKWNQATLIKVHNVGSEIGNGQSNYKAFSIPDNWIAHKVYHRRYTKTQLTEN